MENVMKKFNELSEWVMNLFTLQFLWIIGTLLGGIVLGIIPSTIALYASIRQLYFKREDLKLVTYFKKSYKENFSASLIIGFWHVLAFIIGFIYMSFLNNTTNSWLAYTHLLIYLLLFIIVLTLLFLIPVYTHYEIPLKDLLKTSFFIMASSLKWVIPLILSLTAIFLVFVRFSVVFLFYGISLPAFTVLYFCMRAFEDYEEKRQLYKDSY